MKKKYLLEEILSYILCFLIFFRFIFDGITYPEFNLIFTISLFIIFFFYIILRFKEVDMTYLEFLLFLFLPFSILSFFLSEIKITGIRFNSYFAGYFCLFFLVRNIFNYEKNKEKFYLTILIITLSITIYGIYQRLWGLEETRKYMIENLKNIDIKKISPTFIDRIQSNRIFSTFVYPNIYAGFLISIMPFLFFFSLNKIKTLKGLFSIIIFFLCFLNLILTESMGGLLIFLFIFQIIFLQIILSQLKFKKILPYIIFAEILIIFIGFQLKILPHIHSLIDRILYWKASIKIIPLNPFLGIGPGNFEYYFLKFKLPETLEAKHAHNLFIEIFVENGFFGFLLFFSFLISIIKNCLEKTKNKYLSSGIFYLLISFLLHNLIDFDFYDPSVAILFFIFGGLVREKKITSRKLTKTLICLIIIINLSLGIKLVKFENSERYRKYAEKVIDINLKLFFLKNGENWEKDNFKVYADKGDLFLTMWHYTEDSKFLNEAIFNYNRAVYLNPYLTKAYRKLAYIYEITKNYEIAEKMYLKLLEIYPNKKLYNLEIARFYLKKGEKEKFKYYYEKSKKLKEVTTEEAILTNQIEKWIELQK
ncbi:MAG: O-antigen ligase family protein [Candidatus Ratteibacteria bacterium]